MVCGIDIYSPSPRRFRHCIHIIIAQECLSYIYKRNVFVKTYGNLDRVDPERGENYRALKHYGELIAPTHFRPPIETQIYFVNLNKLKKNISLPTPATIKKGVNKKEVKKKNMLGNYFVRIMLIFAVCERLGESRRERGLPLLSPHTHPKRWRGAGEAGGGGGCGVGGASHCAPPPSPQTII